MATINEIIQSAVDRVKLKGSETWIKWSFWTRAKDVELNSGKNVETAVSELDENISNEIDRATDRENEIETALNSEITRAKSAESTLSTSINNEITRAKNAESTLETNKVPITRTINGKALSSDITLSASDVGADASGSANTALTNAKAYTDTKVADLVGTAPETLDTLEELADALKDNADIVDVLNESITSKASAVDLISHASNNTAHITADERTAWNEKADGDHTHNYAGSSSAGGAATVAEKLSTKRTINDIEFDGTSNIYLPSGRRWWVGSELASSYGWYLFMSKSMKRYEDFNMTLAITSEYDNHYHGMLFIQNRCDSLTETQKPRISWMYRSGWKADDIIAVVDGTTIYFYAFLYPRQYGRICFQVVSESGRGAGTSYSTYQSNSPTTDLTASVTAVDKSVVEGANRLSTARKIGKASFDGSEDISLAAIMGRAQTTRSVGHAGHYTKFATIDVSGSPWICCTGTLEFSWIEAGTLYGKLHYAFRSQSSIASTQILLYWELLSNSKYAETVIATKVSDGVYDLYYRALNANDTMTITNTNSYRQDLLTLYSEQEYVESLENVAFVSKISAMSTKLTTSAGTAMSSGTATQPVYFSDGVPVACTYTLGASVPSGAKFTDTIYTHPTTSGNKHIPSGGSSGQILRWSADGTAVWGADNNTTYSVVSTTADGLAPKRDGSTTKYLRADGTWAVPPDTNTTYTSLKNPYALTIQGNGTTLTNGTYDGSVAKTVNITPSSIGAATSSHGTHVTYGTSASALGTSSAGSAATVSRSDHVHALPALTSCTGTLTVAKGGTGATDAATARTNLGITPANIGAATSSHTHSQSDITSYVHSANGTSGTSGYVKIATLKVSAAYQNEPLVIELTRRGTGTTCTLYIAFASENSTDPALGQFKYIGTNYNCYMYKSATSTWDLYVQKSEAYDNIGVLRYHKPSHMSGVSITWTNALATTPPTGSTVATIGGSIASASTATKLATARTISLTGSVTGSGSFDGSGNLSIATTTNHTHNYLPLSGGTLTGTLNTQNLLPSGNYSIGNSSHLYNYGYFKNTMSDGFYILDSYNSPVASLLLNTSTDVMYYSGNDVSKPMDDVIGLSISSGMYRNMRLYGQNIRLQSENYISSNVKIAMASDEKVKSFTKDIDTDEEKLVKLFDIIKPKSYSYKYVKSDNSLNIGFSAQEIEQAMIDLDIDPEKYGILNIQYGHMLSRGNDFEDGKYYTKFYEISYNDLFNLSLLKTHMMEKEHVERLNSLEARLSALENK